LAASPSPKLTTPARRLGCQMVQRGHQHVLGTCRPFGGLRQGLLLQNSMLASHMSVTR
jgi:hypothetical protein